jgi:AmmeMemoRadiSam system protein B
MKRPPAVAGQFYPGDRTSLARTVTELCGPAIEENQKQKALAVVSPHAGYIYSGRVAGETFSRVHIPEDVIILGPNHHGHGGAVALMDKGAWQMPMGEVPINETLAAELYRVSRLVERDELAHRYEHSLEVQVPFLQFYQPNLTITPLVISHIPYEDCVAVGRDIAVAVRDYNKPVLIVASTDMTHYESRQAASAKDNLAIERILDLDGAGLYETVLGRRISMCGIIPTTVALSAAKELGAKKVDLVRYTDSGETSGDIDQVVGYAGLIIS